MFPRQKADAGCWPGCGDRISFAFLQEIKECMNDDTANEEDIEDVLMALELYAKRHRAFEAKQWLGEDDD